MDTPQGRACLLATPPYDDFFSLQQNRKKEWQPLGTHYHAGAYAQAGGRLLEKKDPTALPVRCYICAL